MSIRIDGTNTTANPGITGGDADTGLQFGTDEVSIATGGTEQVKVDSSGRLLVGTSSSSVGTSIETSGTAISIGGNTNNDAADFRRFEAGTFGPLIFLRKSRNATLGSHTIVNDGDATGGIEFFGSDGTNFVSSARIEAKIDGTPGANDMPGRLVFSTTSDGASSPTERMRITNYGTLQVSNAGSYGASNPTYHDFSANSTNDLILRLRNSSSTTPYGLNIIFDSAAPNDATRYFVNCVDNAAVRATIRSNGGLANYSANNANLSDRNAKKDITPAADTWDCIKEWEIVNYRYKDQPDDADLNLGVIAQQVAESCPEVITVFSEAKEAKAAVLDDEGNEVEAAQEAQPERLGIKEQQMYWMAIKALQEAQVRIEALEAKVASLEAS